MKSVKFYFRYPNLKSFFISIKKKDNQNLS